MARRHHDPVVVRGSRRAGAPPSPEGGAPGTAGGAVAGVVATADATDPDLDLAPRDFVWRGRRYTVCTVLASWQERRAWWREVGDDPSGPPSPQRRVWRVEARPPIGDIGVFDLGRDDDHWLLLRAHD